MRKLIFKVTQTRMWRWLLMEVIPYIRFSMYYTSLNGWDYHRAYNLVEAGDIILTRDNKKMTTMLIGGEFTHAALYLGEHGWYEMCDMTHESFRKCHLFDAFKESDRVAIYRIKMNDEQRFQLTYRAKTFEKCKYDVGFSLGVKTLYCSELIYQAYKMSGIHLDVSLEDLAGLGVDYISPTGLSNAKNATCVYDSEWSK